MPFDPLTGKYVKSATRPVFRLARDMVEFGERLTVHGSAAIAEPSYTRAAWPGREIVLTPDEWEQLVALSGGLVGLTDPARTVPVATGYDAATRTATLATRSK